MLCLTVPHFPSVSFLISLSLSFCAGLVSYVRDSREHALIMNASVPMESAAKMQAKNIIWTGDNPPVVERVTVIKL